MKRFLPSKVILCAALQLLLCQTLHAQYQSSGEDPFGLKFRQIKSPHYSVIYPREIDSLARRYLYLFESTRDVSQEGMRISYPNVPIILHPYAIGGRSAPLWGPKKLEMITTPLATGGLPVNYELDRVLEVNRLLGYMQHYDTHIFHFLQHYIVGQQAVALGVGFRPSVWQATGDAAVFRDDLTGAGPGGSGEFLMYYRAAFVTGDIRGYDNWKYGSYKYFTPDKVALGYLMMSNYRFFSQNYYAIGDLLEVQMRDWWDLFGIWNRSFLEALDKTPRKNWRQTVTYNTHRWHADYLKRRPYTEAVPLLSGKTAIYTADKNPVRLGNVTYATRSGFRDYSQLIEIDSSGRLRTVRPFSETTSRVTGDGTGSLIWSETVKDIRWDLRSYSIIREYDTRTGRMSNVTRRSRYFNPVFSEDLKSILTVEYPVGGGSRAVVIDRRSRETLRAKDAPDNGQITELAQLRGRIYALAITSRGMGLYSADSSFSEVWKQELPPQKSYMQQMSASDDGLVFVSDNDGVCNIYRYSPFDVKDDGEDDGVNVVKDNAAGCDGGSGRLWRLVNSPFGSFYPTLKDGVLYYSSFDNKGYHLSKTGVEDFQMAEVSFDKPYKNEVRTFLERQAADHLTFRSPEGEDSLRTQIDSLESSPYRRSLHGFNIHSWFPLYVNIDRISEFSFDKIYRVASLGATVISQNDLETFTTIAGYSYHNGFHSGHLNVNYSGLYPVFELAVDFNDRKRLDVAMCSHKYSSDGVITPYPLHFNVDTLDAPSLEASFKTYVPLDFSRSGWSCGVVPEVSLGMTNDRYTFTNEYEEKSYPVTYDLTYGLSCYRMLTPSKRQLSPRLGIGLQVKGRNAVGAHNASGNQIYACLYGYLPGITKEQNIRLSACWQHQYGENMTFRYLSNFASMPRGYSSRVLSDYAKATFDYGIFIYLGDVSWPWLFYLYKMDIIPFADFAVDMSQTYPSKRFIHPVPQEFLYSFGTDILLSGHFLRIGSTMSFGLRYARTGEQTNNFSLIFKSNL